MQAHPRSVQGDDLEAAVDAAIAACEGDVRATVRALLVANNFLTEQNATLSAELDWAWHWVSPGYTRTTNRRRMKTGED
jgi:negative regulator of sigma E activity